MSCLVFVILIVILSILSSNLVASSSPPRRELIRVRHGAVAADDGRCSRVGRDVLREGGHAVDAAVAATLCLGVVSPASSGIGGGAFMLLRPARGNAKAFDMRETAPKLASKNMYAGNAALKASGALSIAVPGELAGLHKAWEEYGKLSWKRLVKPAANIARNGFKVSPYLRMQMERTESEIMANKGLHDIFTSNGRLLQKGDVCYNKKLAKTLGKIAEYGIKSLYNGTVGFDLVKDVRKAGGILKVDDLQQYKVKMREPIVVDVMGLTLLGMPPPSSGGAAMSLVLNILEQYKELLNISDSLVVHREIEALKHAFAVRMNLGDPDFGDMKDVLHDMLSKEFAAMLKKNISDSMTFGPNSYGGRWNQINGHGTSHLSVVDGERNAVSITSSINAYFGSKFLSPSTGIVLNNQMDDFSMPMDSSANVPPPAPSNFIHPGKRPLSSMTPTIVLKENKLEGVLGASGGAMIISGTTGVFLNHFLRGMDPLSSVMAPRAYHQLIPNVLQYENWTVVTGDHFEVAAKIRADLQKKGHILQGLSGGTICQFIVRDLDSSSLVAVSDPRKGGFPAGF